MQSSVVRSSRHQRVSSLAQARAGDTVKIHSLPHDGTIRAQFIRLGLHEGQRVRCLHRLPGGTIVLQKNRQQVAVGHQLTKHILVVLGSSPEDVR